MREKVQRRCRLRFFIFLEIEFKNICMYLSSQSRNLPLSMVVIDWFHWVHLGDFGFNPACWPDPKAMVFDS